MKYIYCALVLTVANYNLNAQIFWKEEHKLNGTVITYKTANACSPNTTNISCNGTSSFNLGNTGFVGNNPTQGDNGCNPCCYSGADLDCDGLQDVPFSVENSKWYVYCNNTTSPITVNINIDEPGGGATCNLQGAVWVGASLSTAVMDCGNSNYAQYDSNPGGAADGFTFTPTVPAGQCAYVMIDGYGGSTCSGASVSIVCPVPLAVTLLDFKVERGFRENIITWSTATEKNSQTFVVERLFEGTTSFVQEVIAAGHSDTKLNYEVRDNAYPHVLNYYRLKETDYRGNVVYSRYVAIDNSYKAETPVKIMNVMGQEVSADAPGLKLFYYSDGAVLKNLN